jgi:hypothetical protein
MKVYEAPLSEVEILCQKTSFLTDAMTSGYDVIPGPFSSGTKNADWEDEDYD